MEFAKLALKNIALVVVGTVATGALIGGCFVAGAGIAIAFGLSTDWQIAIGAIGLLVGLGIMKTTAEYF